MTKLETNQNSLFIRYGTTHSVGYASGVFPLSQHFEKNTGKSVLAKWELGTGKVQNLITGRL